MKKTSILSAAFIVAASTFFSCTATIEEEPLPPAPPGPEDLINWADENSGTLEILNGSNKDMVLFVGQTPNEKNILGGVRAGKSKLFDVSDDVSDFNTGGYMVLRGVSLAEYTANIDNLSQAKIDVSTMATYKAGQKYRLNINPSYVGDYGFIVDNNSPIGIELRKDSPRGEKVAYLPALASNQKIYANSADALNLYPVYVYYNTSTGEVSTIETTDIFETRLATPRPMANASSFQRYSFPVSSSGWQGIVNGLTLPNGYITVTNNINNAVFFTRGGGNALMSQSGYDALGTGESLNYEIEGNDEIFGKDEYGEDVSLGGGREYVFVITAYNGRIMVPVTDPTDPDGVVRIMNAYDYSISVRQLTGTTGQESNHYVATIVKGKKRDLTKMISSL